MLSRCLCDFLVVKQVDQVSSRIIQKVITAMSTRESSGVTSSSHRGPGRPPRSVPNFPFKTGNLVLVKWNDGMVYFAKIKRIDKKRCKCIVVFDDKSQDEAHFSQIHSGRSLIVIANS